MVARFGAPSWAPTPQGQAERPTRTGAEAWRQDLGLRCSAEKIDASEPKAGRVDLCGCREACLAFP